MAALTSKILWVDDDPMIETLINLYFKKKKDKSIQVYFCANGLEALDFIKEHQDLKIVILDLNMPVMDGYTFLKKSEKFVKDRDMKVIICSSSDSQADHKETKELGASNYITKPFDLDAVFKTLEEIDD